jgi:glycine cleavage system H protein
MPSVKYSQEHEWISVEGDVGTIGITQYAQEQLGDVVFVDVPKAGRKVAKGEACAVVESVKAASDIYAPVSGEVTEANAALADAPGDVNAEPMGKGWFFKLKLSDKSELDALMDQGAYEAFVKSLG